MLIGLDEEVLAARDQNSPFLDGASDMCAPLGEEKRFVLLRRNNLPASDAYDMTAPSGVLKGPSPPKEEDLPCLDEVCDRSASLGVVKGVVILLLYWAYCI